MENVEFTSSHLPVMAITKINFSVSSVEYRKLSRRNQPILDCVQPVNGACLNHSVHINSVGLLFFSLPEKYSCIILENPSKVFEDKRNSIEINRNKLEV